MGVLFCRMVHIKFRCVQRSNATGSVGYVCAAMVVGLRLKVELIRNVNHDHAEVSGEYTESNL